MSIEADNNDGIKEAELDTQDEISTCDGCQAPFSADLLTMLPDTQLCYCPECLPWAEKEEEAVKIESGISDALDKRRAWLIKRGWVESCAFPDSCWRWCKQIKDKFVCTNEADAFRMERNFTTT